MPSTVALIFVMYLPLKMKIFEEMLRTKTLALPTSTDGVFTVYISLPVMIACLLLCHT